jgi:hypothetical protein
MKSGMDDGWSQVCSDGVREKEDRKNDKRGSAPVTPIQNVGRVESPVSTVGQIKPTANEAIERETRAWHRTLIDQSRARRKVGRSTGEGHKRT